VVEVQINPLSNSSSAGYNPFDALIVDYYETRTFVPHLRQEIYERFKKLASARCLFVNLPEKRRTQWALTKG